MLGDMQRLASTDISDKVLETMFLKKLPEQLASILAGSSETLIKLGELADRIHAFHKSTTPHVAAYSTASAPVAPFSAVPVLDSELKQIKTMLASIMETDIKLSTRIAELEVEQRIHRSQSRNRSPGRSPSRQRSSS